MSGTICIVLYINNIPFSTTYIHREIGIMLESSLAVPLPELIRNVSSSCSSSDVIQQIVECFPVLAVTKGDITVLINCHELIMNDDGFEALLVVDQISKSSHKGPFEKAAPSPISPTPVTHNRMGRPSLVTQFPSIVSTATAFVKANGFSAHERRRESTGKVGVSLREIREHLLSTVPGLKGRGISIS